MVSMPPLLSDCFWVARHDDHERHSWSLSQQATQQHVHTNDYTIYVKGSLYMLRQSYLSQSVASSVSVH